MSTDLSINQSLEVIIPKLFMQLIQIRKKLHVATVAKFTWKFMWRAFRLWYINCKFYILVSFSICVTIFRHYFNQPTTMMELLSFNILEYIIKVCFRHFRFDLKIIIIVFYKFLDLQLKNTFFFYLFKSFYYTSWYFVHSVSNSNVNSFAHYSMVSNPLCQNYFGMFTGY